MRMDSTETTQDPKRRVPGRLDAGGSGNHIGILKLSLSSAAPAA